MKRIILISLCILCSITFMKAGNETKTKKYSKFPYWIAMMDDEKTNYFEAIKAFESFWEHRAKPIEEKEILGDKLEEYSNDSRSLARRMKKLPPADRNLTFQYKKFINWLRESKPYVQEDGSILTQAERLKIFNSGK